MEYKRIRRIRAEPKDFFYFIRNCTGATGERVKQ
nr:MAG TPA_asm: hypothetical protein [Caudoviricetes sp.]